MRPGRVARGFAAPGSHDPGVTVSRHRALLTSQSGRGDPLMEGEQAGRSFE